MVCGIGLAKQDRRCQRGDNKKELKQINNYN